MDTISQHEDAAVITRVKSEGHGPVTTSIVLGDLLSVRAHMSYRNGHAIVEARFTNGVLEMSAPALIRLVREGQQALATPVPGAESRSALSDYPLERGAK
jgi:hypothetical protein